MNIFPPELLFKIGYLLELPDFINFLLAFKLLCSQNINDYFKYSSNCRFIDSDEGIGYKIFFNNKWLKHGFFKLKYLSRISAEGNFSFDLREGIWKTNYSIGITFSIHTYLHDILQGPAKGYYPNGNIHYEGNYSNGEKVDNWEYHTVHGFIIRGRYIKGVWREL